MVQFWLNDQPISAPADTDTTLLTYIRQCAHLTGTKEGCASGDCGACTVLLGQLEGEHLAYHPINSCITPLGAVHGCQVVTIEQLQGRHPIQRALVDHHGSQCGFCTPGIVLALAARAQALGGNLSREQAVAALGGNLCRCTGYRPILDAAQHLLDYPPAADLASPETKAGLAQCPALTDADYAYPEDLPGLWAARAARPDARLIAGGTDLMLEVTQRLVRIPALIDLSGVRELKRVALTETELWIGAGVTFERLDQEVGAYIPALPALLARIGSPQVRARGTLGGNLGTASPVGDLAPVLLALEAEVGLVGPRGRRRLPLMEFFTGYRATSLSADEIIEGVAIARPHLADPLFIYKLSKRFEDDISSVLLAARFVCQQGQVVSAHLGLGGVAATPIRALAVEARLAGAPIGDLPALAAAQTALAQALSPLSDVRASAGYRRAMAAALLEKAWRQLAGEAIPNLGGDARHA